MRATVTFDGKALKIAGFVGGLTCRNQYFRRDLKVQTAVGFSGTLVGKFHFFRLALMTLGSCAIRPAPCDSCGSPVIDISIRICAMLSRLSVTVFHAPDADLSSASAALTSRTQSRGGRMPGHRFHDGNSFEPILPQATRQHPRRGLDAEAGGELAQDCA